MSNRLLTSYSQRPGATKFRMIENAASSLAELTLLVAGGHRRVDAAAHVEVAGHRHSARLASSNQIVENLIDHRFMKRALIAVRPQIELQRFQLDTVSIGHVANPD